MSGLRLKRRDALKGLLAISAANALAACTADNSKSESGDSVLKYAAPNQFLNADEILFLGAVAQTIIPKTETAGAIEAGVPDTLQDLLSDWGDDNFRRYWRNGLRDLKTSLNKAHGDNFAKADAKTRDRILSKTDNDIYSGTVENNFYKDMKSTIATAYYMSEPGATEELIYDPVPGEWRGCVPFSEIGKSWAT